MQISYFLDQFAPIQIPIAKNNVFWNGRVDEFSNLPGRIIYSQSFGMTDYAKSGVYGYYLGSPRPHNGHDFAGGKGIPLVFPCRAYVTYIGFDEDGYGNFVFFETETIKVNGYQIKMEFVLAHLDSFDQDLKLHHWYDEGAPVGAMGSTGMSTGPHTHFGGRPLLVNSSGGTSWAVGEAAERGYVDLTDFFLIKPIENKQDLLDQFMELVKLKGEDDYYAIDSKGQANLIQNWASYQRGLEMGLWAEEPRVVNALPKKRNIIILSPDN